MVVNKNMSKLILRNKKKIVAYALNIVIFLNLFLPLFPKDVASAQEGYFPRYPERLKYVIGEITQASHDLIYLNQKLEDLTSQCDCSHAISQCGRGEGLAPKRIEINTGLFEKIGSMDPEEAIVAAEAEIKRLKDKVSDSINSLSFSISVAKQQGISLEKKWPSLASLLSYSNDGYEEARSVDNYSSQGGSSNEEAGDSQSNNSQTKTKNIQQNNIKSNLRINNNNQSEGQGEIEENYINPLKDNIKDFLNKSKRNIRLTKSEIEELKEHLNSLKKLKNTLNESENRLKLLKEKIINETKGEIMNEINSIVGQVESEINNIKELPQELINKLISLGEELKDKITSLPKKIKDILLHQSCGPGKPEVFGDTCPNRQEIDNTEIDIKNKIDQINNLRELLIAEKENGLADELKTLPKNEQKELTEGINKIIDSTEKLISSESPSNLNINILNNDEYSSTNKCKANCKKGIILRIVACILQSAGVEEPIKLTFEIGVALKDLKLGTVKAHFGINLPDKIKINGINKLKDIKIYLPDVDDSIDVNHSAKTLNISLPSPKLPSPPNFYYHFSLPEPNDYNCYSGQEKKGEESQPEHYIDVAWYFQTFSWLSKKCQDIREMKGDFNMPNFKCFNINNVHLTIIKACDSAWVKYLSCRNDAETRNNCYKPAGICLAIGPSKEALSSLSNPVCDWTPPCNRKEAEKIQCQNLFQSLKEKAPGSCGLTALEKKCSELRKKKVKDAPEPCKYLPLFTRKYGLPDSDNYSPSSGHCSPQSVTDNSGLTLSGNSAGISGELNAPLPIPKIPTLKLPDIKIPDLILPEFSFMPFFKIKLPSFIFEDLHFPELTLCNLDSCRNIIPPIFLHIPYPHLSIPGIDIPPIPIPGMSAGYKIKIGKIEFPPIPIPMPSIDLRNLISAKLDLPGIQLPMPKIIIRLTGIDIPVFDLLLGLISSIIHIPTGCIALNFHLIPIIIGFPDFYFYWPKFPKIPDLCNNKYISVNKFCTNIKNKLDEKLDIDKVQSKIDEISNIINEEIEDNIQKYLDAAADDFNEEIAKAVSAYVQKFAEVKERIKEKIENGKKNKVIEKILSLKGKEISIPMDKINNELAKIPNEIPLHWPQKLKEKMKDLIDFDYQLPTIPLEGLSWKKKKEIPLFGLQVPHFNIILDVFGRYPSCKGKSPSGGNPYPLDKIKANIESIKKTSQEVDTYSEEIINVLE